MKCLTVIQPWAWAILRGGKRYENRSWPTKYRGPLLIHAGKSLRFWDWFGERVEEWAVTFPCKPDLVFGAIIGRVELVDCLSVARVVGEPFAEGPYCWKLANPVPFPEPIPCRGQQGLFEVDHAG